MVVEVPRLKSLRLEVMAVVEVERTKMEPGCKQVVVEVVEQQEYMLGEVELDMAEAARVQERHRLARLGWPGRHTTWRLCFRTGPQ